MHNEDYTTTILVNANCNSAFHAILNLKEWWSQEITGTTDELNKTFFYHYKDVHRCKLKLIEKTENERIVYLILDNHFNFVEDKTEWVNTKLIFEIKDNSNGTTIIFTHKGLSPSHECFPVCNDAWNGYINGSLKQLIETGTGKPNAKEGGLNAELVEKWGLPNK